MDQIKQLNLKVLKSFLDTRVKLKPLRNYKNWNEFRIIVNEFLIINSLRKIGNFNKNFKRGYQFYIRKLINFEYK